MCAPQEFFKSIKKPCSQTMGPLKFVTYPGASQIMKERSHSNVKAVITDALKKVLKSTKKRSHTNVWVVRTCSLIKKIKSTSCLISWKKKPFKFEICYHSCSEKGFFKLHVTSVHEGKKPCKCKSWDNRFSTNHNLEKHIVKKKEGYSNVKVQIIVQSFPNKGPFMK